MDDDGLTPEEERAIAALRRLAKRWPQSLRLFGASGTLQVRKGEGGAQTEVATILEISADGGDGGDYY